MTRTIAEIPLPSPDVTAKTPVGGKVLGVRVQGGQPVIFMLVDPGAPIAPRRFVVIPNGAQLSPAIDECTYIGNMGRGQNDTLHVFEAPLFAQLVIGIIAPPTL